MVSDAKTHKPLSSETATQYSVILFVDLSESIVECTVESSKFEVLGTRGFVLKYRKF